MANRGRIRRLIRRLLATEVETIQSQPAAEAVVDRLEQIASDRTEAEAGDAAPAAARLAIEAAAETDHPDAVAKVLAEVAAEAVSPGQASGPVTDAAQDVFSRRRASAWPSLRRSRRLLQAAVLERMGPLSALDARIYLAINNARTPRWLDVAIHTITTLASGGWGWIGGAALASLVGVPGSGSVLRCLLPGVVGTTLIVENLIKTYFRRRRPFIRIVRALVIGKRPGSWSFPSGHTASSFAAATILGLFWPQVRPIFYGLASIVGFSRVYVGAHYPGDVLSGAFFGVVLANLISILQRKLRIY